jgi:integrase
MKSGREHRVPLSSRALAILEGMAEFKTGDDLVFPGQRRGRPLGQAAIRSLCPTGTTVHGFRSSFRDWMAEETHFRARSPRRHWRMSRAMRRRGDALEKRRALMEAWGSYCEPDSGGDVIQFGQH